MLPNSDVIMNQSFWIGLWPGLSSSDLDYMISKIHQFMEEANG